MNTTFKNSFSEEVWASTYKYHKDTNINDTLRRVARAVAGIETTEENKKVWEENFYDMLSGFKVVPGGRILSNAGTDYDGTTLINCYVLPGVKGDIDSLEGILKKLRYQSLTLKSEGGVGFNISGIRPRGSYINGIGVETPGAIKFAELFDKSSEIITAGSGLERSNKKAKGKIRKGAQMLVMDVWSNDIVEFITAKQVPGRLTKFNMSVNVSNDFMDIILKIENMKAGGASEEEIKAVDKWDLVFPDTTFKHYKKEWDGNLAKWKSKGYPIIVHQTVEASWLWNLIMTSTYTRAEPGVLFLERANELNNMWYNERDYIDACNPCGEQLLPHGGNCLLSSLNLTQFVNEDRTFDFKNFEKYVGVAIRFMDNVNDLTTTPLPEYDEYIKSRRRVGLGIMGWGSVLYMMGIRFASDEANKLKELLMNIYTRTGIKTSINLAKEKGMFSACEPENHANSKFFQQIGLESDIIADIKKYGIRNSSLFSVQPTGNTGVMANNISGGIEPIFTPEYIRTVIVNFMPDYIKEVTPKWYEGQFYETEMFKIVKEGEEEILRGVAPDGTVYKIDKNRGLTKEVLCEDYGVLWLKERNLWNPEAEYIVSTNDLSADDHIADLKGFAKFVDSAISKTINLPNDYSYENFKNIYLDGYNTGYIKGLTTYRAGTMTSVLSAKEENTADDFDEEIILDHVHLPSKANATMATLKAEGRKWYLTSVYNDNQNRPFAVFVHTNHPEKSTTTNDAVERLVNLAYNKKIRDEHITNVIGKIYNESNTAKLTRMVSFLLRHGVLIKNIVSELENVENVGLGSFLYQLTKYLSQYIKDGEKIEGEECPNCGTKNSMVYSEGCRRCLSCDSSRC